MKEGCLFVLFVVTLKFPKTWCPWCALGVVQKPLTSKGASSWLHNVLTCGEKNIEY
jgi:hypothetical protein